MTNEKFLKNVKKRAFLTYHQDGLVEILVGVCLLAFAMLAAVETEGTLFGWAILFLFIPLKNHITVPRLGFVKFADAKKNTSSVIMIVVLSILFLSVGLIAGYLVSHDVAINDFYDEYSVVITSSVSVLIFLILGLFTKLEKFILYSGLITAVIAFALFQNIHPGIYLSGIGIVLIAIGSIQLNKFMKKYPALEENGYESHE